MAGRKRTKPADFRGILRSGPKKVTTEMLVLYVLRRKSMYTWRNDAGD